MAFVSPIMEQALAVAAERSGLTVAQITGGRKSSEIAKVRQCVMYATQRAGLSLPQIGRALNRDHTTVLHGVRKVRRARGAGEGWADLSDTLERAVAGLARREMAFEIDDAGREWLVAA